MKTRLQQQEEFVTSEAKRFGFGLLVVRCARLYHSRAPNQAHLPRGQLRTRPIMEQYHFEHMYWQALGQVLESAPSAQRDRKTEAPG